MKFIKNLILFIFLKFVTCLAFTPNDFQFSTGFDYSSGDYGSSSDTNLLYIPLTSKMIMDKFEIKLTVPYLIMSSNSDSINIEGEPFILSDAEKDADESGMGDIVASFNYFFLDEEEWRPYIDLIGKIKFGTADEKKGLGTGENDFSVEVDLTKPLDSSVLFGTIGYKIYGDPDEIDLDNVFYFSLGISQKINPAFIIGCFYDFRQKTSSYGNTLSEITVYSDYKLSDKYKILSYALIGFSDGSADYGIGISLTMKTDIEEVKKPFVFVRDWFRK